MSETKINKYKCLARIHLYDESYRQCSRRRINDTEYCRTHLKKFQDETLVLGSIAENLDDVKDRNRPEKEEKKLNQIVNEQLENHAIDNTCKQYWVIERKINGRKVYFSEKDKLVFCHPKEDSCEIDIIGAYVNNNFLKILNFQDKRYFMDNKDKVYSEKYNCVGRWKDNKIKFRKNLKQS